jgi:hypothetical protein
MEQTELIIGFPFFLMTHLEIGVGSENESINSEEFWENIKRGVGNMLPHYPFSVPS